MTTYDQMREALKYIVSLLRSDTFVVLNPPAVEIISKILLASEAALALPRRNCDVGTAEEQGTRCLAQIRAWRFAGPRIIDSIMKWTQMPYEEDEGGVE